MRRAHGERQRQTMLRRLRPVKRSISVQTLASWDSAQIEDRSAGRQTWKMLLSRCKKSCELSDIRGSIFWSLTLFRTCLLPAVNWMAVPGEYCELQPSSSSYRRFPLPIVKFEMLKWLINFDWDHLSSFIIAVMYWSMKSDWGYQMFQLDQIFCMCATE